MADLNHSLKEHSDLAENSLAAKDSELQDVRSHLGGARGANTRTQTRINKAIAEKDIYKASLDREQAKASRCANALRLAAEIDEASALRKRELVVELDDEDEVEIARPQKCLRNTRANPEGV
jgi:hypothetical protein